MLITTIVFNDDTRFQLNEATTWHDQHGTPNTITGEFAGNQIMIPMSSVKFVYTRDSDFTHNQKTREAVKALVLPVIYGCEILTKAALGAFRDSGCEDLAKAVAGVVANTNSDGYSFTINEFVDKVEDFSDEPFQGKDLQRILDHLVNYSVLLKIGDKYSSSF